jgi:restriction endonuclease Mrr
MRKKYSLGQEYIDKASRYHEDDQFLGWINLDGSGMGNSEGIRSLQFLSNLKSMIPAYLILVTHEKTAGKLNPWDDYVDMSNAQIMYWGDAKASKNKRVDDFKGNKTLRAIFDYILTGSKDLVPPILHFSKPKAGIVKFNGLCVLDQLDISWFDDHGTPVQNYHAKLTILDCAEVSVDWLHNRVQSESLELVDKHKDVPDSWLQYKKGKKSPIDIWISYIRSQDQQLPSVDSSENLVLKQLVELEPFAFEKVIVSLFRQLTEITHHISGTKATGDGGFDFFGTFKLPHPIGYEIPFRGEVKRYSRGTAVDPKSVSRLVARLSRKEYGLFVTTSYFTKQAQREVLEDAYPVHLISGGDLILMFKYLGIIRDGMIRKEWLEASLDN